MWYNNHPVEVLIFFEPRGETSSSVGSALLLLLLKVNVLILLMFTLGEKSVCETSILGLGRSSLELLEKTASSIRFCWLVAGLPPPTEEPIMDNGRDDVGMYWKKLPLYVKVKPRKEKDQLLRHLKQIGQWRWADHFRYEVLERARLLVVLNYALQSAVSLLVMALVEC